MTESLFAPIIAIFSGITLFLLSVFVIWWLFSRRANYGRGRRITMSQRDILASYNVINKDASKISEIMKAEPFDESRINEAKFLAERINENAEKMKKYVSQGIEKIGKYDVIKKYNKEFKK